MTARTATAFVGHERLATGPLAEVARRVWRTMKETAPSASVLIFDDETGRVIDLEMRGDESDMLAHLEATTLRDAPPASTIITTDHDQVDHDRAMPRARGRPRLGVVAREVTLLPRHWEWLATQPGGASVALRRLVESARRANADADQVKASRDAAYRFMHAAAGDLPEFEEATRALFRGDAARFRASIGAWPGDLREYAFRLAFPAHAD